ncbi:unnamed protein product [Lampetra planeri]
MGRRKAQWRRNRKRRASEKNEEAQESPEKIVQEFSSCGERVPVELSAVSGTIPQHDSTAKHEEAKALPAGEKLREGLTVEDAKPLQARKPVAEEGQSLSGSTEKAKKHKMERGKEEKDKEGPSLEGEAPTGAAFGKKEIKSKSKKTEVKTEQLLTTVESNDTQEALKLVTSSTSQSPKDKMAVEDINAKRSEEALDDSATKLEMETKQNIISFVEAENVIVESTQVINVSEETPSMTRATTGELLSDRPEACVEAEEQQQTKLEAINAKNLCIPYAKRNVSMIQPLKKKLCF